MAKTVTPNSVQINFLIDSSIKIAMERIRERDGIPLSEQMRRAIKQWCNERGELTMPKRGRQ